MPTQSEQRTNIAGAVAKPATRVAEFTAKGEKLRRCRVKMNAAQTDVAAVAGISHTILSERENGISGDDRHDSRIERGLVRIGVAKMRAIVEALEEVA